MVRNPDECLTKWDAEVASGPGRDCMDCCWEVDLDTGNEFYKNAADCHPDFNDQRTCYGVRNNVPEEYHGDCASHWDAEVASGPGEACEDSDSLLQTYTGWESYACSGVTSYCQSHRSVVINACPVTCGFCGGDFEAA